MALFTADTTDLDHAREPTAAELDDYERKLPVEMRLDAALADIPHAIARKGIPLEAIRVRLRGRSRGHAHSGELSAALFKRGWTRRQHQELRSGGQCVTLWYPPGVDPVKQTVEERPKMPRGRPPKWLAYALNRAKAEGRPI